MEEVFAPPQCIVEDYAYQWRFYILTIRLLFSNSMAIKILSNQKYNKLYARIRLLDTQKGYSLIREMFHPLDTWPNFLIEIFVKPLREKNYSER